MSAVTKAAVTRIDKGPVAWLSLNRAEAMNALSERVLDALAAHLADIEDERDVRVVVVTATGRAFCAGADLKEVLGPDGKVDPARLLAFEKGAAETFAMLASLPKPVIAALNGITMAGGLELALHCDLVVASADARLGDGHINYGLLPGAGGAARLPRVVGPTRAKYLAFTGELVTAKEAQAMGLVNEVVPADQLVTRAEELATTIARRSPSALRLFKQAIDDGLDQPLASALRLERLVTAEHLHSGDVDEGLRAFAEKRAPLFETTSGGTR
jgi:enoyl-CoA hydratase/carnithine racemase